MNEKRLADIVSIGVDWVFTAARWLFISELLHLSLPTLPFLRCAAIILLFSEAVHLYDRARSDHA